MPTMLDNPAYLQQAGTFDWGAAGYESTGTPDAPYQDATVVPFHRPTLPVWGVDGFGPSAVQHTRTVDPHYGQWYDRAHFLGQGFYDQVPDQLNHLITGQGTPNKHPRHLRAGVIQNLVQYSSDPYTYSAAYVGQLDPQVVSTGVTGMVG